MRGREENEGRGGERMGVEGRANTINKIGLSEVAHLAEEAAVLSQQNTSGARLMCVYMKSYTKGGWLHGII